ncbi:MAG: peptidase M50, partial [Gammaproteobacteria bacterium]|nr:peptidase M50 [Gammaproteobacteria bacterium]NNL99230.1 peptidase M50 [Gammaproteobacteria bacterium]
LMTLADPDLASELSVIEYQLEEARARRRALQVDDAVQAEITDEEIANLEGRLARLRERMAALAVTAPVDGIYVLPRQDDLAGRFFRQGEQVAYVVAADDSTARVVVDQGRIDLVRRRIRNIEVRPSHRVEQVIPARILREVPAATNELPSLALGSAGGGQVALDPRDNATPRSLDSLFQFDLALEQPVSLFLGSRLLVRFDHGYETLAARWYRALRQLLLARFSV